MSISIKFEPRDLWVGIYWNLGRGTIKHTYRCLRVYVCILPMLPIVFTFEWWLKTRYEVSVRTPLTITSSAGLSPTEWHEAHYTPIGTTYRYSDEAYQALAEALDRVWGVGEWEVAETGQYIQRGARLGDLVVGRVKEVRG